MPYEILVGLNVTNQSGYQAYRDAMAPILAKYGGSFRFDFTVAATLKSEAPHPINRVFTIAFKDSRTKDAFFADAEYREVRAKHFEPSVNGSTVIAKYELAP